MYPIYTEVIADFNHVLHKWFVHRSRCDRSVQDERDGSSPRKLQRLWPRWRLQIVPVFATALDCPDRLGAVLNLIIRGDR